MAAEHGISVLNTTSILHQVEVGVQHFLVNKPESSCRYFQELLTLALSVKNALDYKKYRVSRAPSMFYQEHDEELTALSLEGMPSPTAKLERLIADHNNLVLIQRFKPARELVHGLMVLTNMFIEPAIPPYIRQSRISVPVSENNIFWGIIDRLY